MQAEFDSTFSVPPQQLQQPLGEFLISHLRTSSIKLNSHHVPTRFGASFRNAPLRDGVPNVSSRLLEASASGIDIAIQQD